MHKKIQTRGTDLNFFIAHRSTVTENRRQAASERLIFTWWSWNDTWNFWHRYCNKTEWNYKHMNLSHASDMLTWQTKAVYGCQPQQKHNRFLLQCRIQYKNHAALPPTLGTVVVTRWYNDARKIKQILISKWHEIGGDDWWQCWS